MLFSDSHILSTILFTPLIGAILMLFISRERADLHRWMGNLFGFLGLLVSLPLIWKFQSERTSAIAICGERELDSFSRSALHAGN